MSIDENPALMKAHLGVVVDLERRRRRLDLGPGFAGAAQVGAGAESAAGSGECRHTEFTAAEPIHSVIHVNVCRPGCFEQSRAVEGLAQARENQANSNLLAFDQPLGLHREQAQQVRLRGIGVQFAIASVHVDHDAFGVQPGRVLAEVDRVNRLGQR